MMTVLIRAATRRSSCAATRSTDRLGWVLESNRSPAISTTSTRSRSARSIVAVKAANCRSRCAAACSPRSACRAPRCTSAVWRRRSMRLDQSSVRRAVTVRRPGGLPESPFGPQRRPAGLVRARSPHCPRPPPGISPAIVTGRVSRARVLSDEISECPRAPEATPTCHRAAMSDPKSRSILRRQSTGAPRAGTPDRTWATRPGSAPPLVTDGWRPCARHTTRTQRPSDLALGGGAHVTYVDRTLNCVDCGVEFIHSAADQEFYTQKGFSSDPKRCASCRASRRATRDTGYDVRDIGGPRGYQRGGDRPNPEDFPGAWSHGGDPGQAP